MVKKKEG